MLVDHEAPAACPEGATLECTLQQGLELWRRKDFPAAASVFIPLAEQQDAELGLAATEYAIASLHALLQERPSCEIVLLEFAPRMAERHCPATPSPGTCHMIQEVQFMVLRNRALRVATDDPTTWVGLFERFCAEGGPFNNQHAAPLDAECDDVLSNAYRLAKRAGNSQLSERLRAALLDPANRLKGSRITEDFDP